MSASLSNFIAATSRGTVPSSPLHVPHLYWRCFMSGAKNTFPVTFKALIDHGSSSVLIRDSFVTEIGLRCQKLPEPFSAELAMENNGRKVMIQFTEYVKVQLHDPSAYWSSKTVHAIIAPGLCAPMILGLPFLAHNNIVVDASARTVIDKNSNFDLLNPTAPPAPKPPKQKLKDLFVELQENRKLMIAELKMVCAERLYRIKRDFEPVKLVDIIATVRECIEVLAAQEVLLGMGKDIMTEFTDVFSSIPHLEELPMDVYCRITLKDASKSVQTRSYSTPRKY
jgi:hypothetical protein